MNNTQCPNCQKQFSFSNPPKKLKNCDHNLCDACLPSTTKCPLDQKRIDYRKYTAKGFQINHQLLDQLEKVRSNSNSQPQSPRKGQRRSVAVESTPKKEYQYCLLHSKPADIICCVDGNLICASCALFGEHRGHHIKNCDQVLNKLTVYTEQALQVFDKLKQKQENLNEQIVSQYIDDCFVQQKNQQLKNVKQGFAKLLQKIKKAQKTAITRLDQQIKTRKQYLMKQVSIHQLQTKKNQWYKQVQTLGTITQHAYQFKNIQEALRYLDQKSSQSFLLKRGEYLQIEYLSSENVIKSKIDSQTGKMVAVFSQGIDRAIDQFCTYAGSLQKKENNKLNQSCISIIDKKTQDDILIDQLPSRSELSDSGFKRQIYLKPQLQTKSGYLIGIKIPEVNIIQSVHPAVTEQNLDKQKGSRSRSIKQRQRSGTTDGNVLANRQNQMTSDVKKRKKIDIPEKYRQVFDDLKNDRSEVIDFGGAQLGDQNILALCQYIEKTNKLRNLKLVRNKLSDQVIKQLLNACYCAKVTSLNLGQNSLTEKSLQMFENFDLGQLRNITLSLNKINRRNVKARLEQFGRRGITLSI